MAGIQAIRCSCDLCKNAIAGELDLVKFKLERTKGQTCSEGTTVYHIVKFYSKALRDYAHKHEIPLSDVWKEEEIQNGQCRTNVKRILELLFGLGYSANYCDGDETALLCVISSHDEGLLKLLLENGADPNYLTPFHRLNALALTIILNEASMIKLIISYGAKINEPCCESLTPLQLSMHKSVEVSKILLQNGADVQQVMQMNGTNDVLISKPPLIHAVETDNMYLVNVLLEHGEDINQTYGEFSNTPLHFAITRGNIDVVKLLIQFGAYLDKRNGRGFTPLCLALHQPLNGLTMCEALLSAGCSRRKSSMINVFQRHFPPFHVAAFLGYGYHLDILKMLLNLSQEPEKCDALTNMMNNAIVYADKQKHSLSISERESDLKKREHQKLVNLQAIDKSTALVMAVLGGNLKIAQYLYSEGADPYIYSCHGNLLHAAVMASKMGKEMLDFALSFDFNIDLLNDDGNSPLILAARNSNSQLCQVLVKQGAQLNLRDGRFGETALCVSVYFGFEDNAETLICHGANPDIPDERLCEFFYLEKSFCVTLI